MRNITIREKEFKVMDNWADLSVQKYIEIAKLYNQYEHLIQEEFLVKFITIISTLDESFTSELYEDELLLFTDLVNNFSMETLKAEKIDHFIFDDKIYSYNNIGKLTLGEKISLKLLEKNMKDEYDLWLNILGILVRPALKKTNEFNEVYYEVESFVGDIDLIDKRKELIKSIPAINAIYIIENFTSGRE
jgi:hypothetical protein